MVRLYKKVKISLIPFIKRGSCPSLVLARASGSRSNRDGYGSGSGSGSGDGNGGERATLEVRSAWLMSP